MTEPTSAMPHLSRNRRSKPISAIVVVLSTIAAAVPQAQGRDVSECDALAVELAARLGIATERRTDLGNFHMRHPYAKDILLSCQLSDTPPILDLSYGSATPPITFYNIAKAAGALVTGARPEAVLEGILRCNKAALRDKSEFADLTHRGLRFECRAFTRDGGGTLITIYKAPRE